MNGGWMNIYEIKSTMLDYGARLPGFESQLGNFLVKNHGNLLNFSLPRSCLWTIDNMCAYCLKFWVLTEIIYEKHLE